MEIIGGGLRVIFTKSKALMTDRKIVVPYFSLVLKSSYAYHLLRLELCTNFKALKGTPQEEV